MEDLPFPGKVLILIGYGKSPISREKFCFGPQHYIKKFNMRPQDLHEVCNYLR